MNEQQLNCILYTGDNILDVLAFTGRHERFDEWFKSDEEYVEYVKAHNNIFKLFNNKYGKMEILPGTWIAKLPDGGCLPIGRPLPPKKAVNEDLDLKIDGKKHFESFDPETRKLVENVILTTMDVCNEFGDGTPLFFYESVAYSVFCWIVMGHLKRKEFYNFKENCWETVK
jgi:hypothetical protein